MEPLSMVLFPLRQLFKLGVIVVQAFCVVWFLWAAYDIRMYPIKDYGMIIHEFDPWFNYRAAQYMADNGPSKFFKWYDYESWYPLGRPIGTTTYPGMQLTAVGIREAMLRIPEFSMDVPKEPFAVVRRLLSSLRKRGLKFLPSVPKKISFTRMSVNDICCMIPPWFGSLASLFLGLLTYEISRSVMAAVVGIGIMSVIPAHLMRSVGGEFDNEAVAVCAICMTFWLWLRSVRTPGSWPWGVLAGASYVYMVAAWGGYIFVLNTIGVHALILVGLGRFNSGVYKAYTLFFVIGTAGAVQVPVVGWQPLRSLEQIGPLGVFMGYQVLQFCDYMRRKQDMDTKQFVMFRVKVFVVFGAALAFVGMMLWPTGYFGPISSRIRGLFVKHTKTGNPLVDSVAEHQPANKSMYASYLNMPLDYAYLGALVCLFRRSNAGYFLFIYGFVAEHFSGKMNRLVLICGPIVSVACAVWAGFLLDLVLEPFLLLLGKEGIPVTDGAANEDKPAAKKGKDDSKQKANGNAKGKEDKGKKAQRKPEPSISKMKFEPNEWEDEERPGGMSFLLRAFRQFVTEALPEDVQSSYRVAKSGLSTNFSVLLARAGLSIVLVFYVTQISGLGAKMSTFVRHCDSVAQSLSNPQVVYKVNDRQGNEILVDDYLTGYQWIDANTPRNSRVMAWWDYGYQITGIARRTSIADGNTWNHEHIATLGRMLTSPEKKAHNAIRHLADYVLVWAGGQGDDLAKSPHLARIGNSVFPDHCGDDDPKCNKFGFYQGGVPTPMMAKSLLYKLVMHNLKPKVKVSDTRFQEVHTTRHGLMRVFKVMNVSEESREWIADPKNKECDAPGSWYCVGKYPPALQKLIAKRRNFAQLEDFNREGGAKSAYSKLIEKELAGGGGADEL